MLNATTSAVPVTLTSLLCSRSLENGTGIYFLDDSGRVAETLSYADMYHIALSDSQRLRSLITQLEPEVDVIIASLSNNASHVRLFWACCFGSSYYSSGAR